MVNTKELREIVDEATRRAADAMSEAKVPQVTIGRRSENGLAIFAAGLLLGAVAGLVLAFLVTPFSGEQARQKLGDRMDRVRRQREEALANGDLPSDMTVERPQAARG